MLCSTMNVFDRGQLSNFSPFPIDKVLAILKKEITSMWTEITNESSLLNGFYNTYPFFFWGGFLRRVEAIHNWSSIVILMKKTKESGAVLDYILKISLSEKDLWLKFKYYLGKWTYSQHWGCLRKWLCDMERSGLATSNLGWPIDPSPPRSGDEIEAHLRCQRHSLFLPRQPRPSVWSKHLPAKPGALEGVQGDAISCQSRQWGIPRRQ